MREQGKGNSMRTSDDGNGTQPDLEKIDAPAWVGLHECPLALLMQTASENKSVSKTFMWTLTMVPYSISVHMCIVWHQTVNDNVEFISTPCALCFTVMF